MAAPLKFLVIDDNPDSRFLLVKTLMRKFPNAVLLECQQSTPAINIARAETPTAVIIHRAEDIDGITLVRQLREANDIVPIVMVSGIDRAREALAAGATSFLHYDAWLRIGTLVSELIGRDATASPFPPAKA